MFTLSIAMAVAAGCANTGEGVPDAPILAALADSCGGTTRAFDWSAVPGATAYELEYGLVGATPEVVRVDGAITSYTPAEPLAPGDWTARVRAVAGEALSEDSETISFRVLEMPVASVSNDGPGCPGAPVQLTAANIPGASYRWTGPGGFTSSEQNPVIDTQDPASLGNYSLVVTVGECSSEPAITAVEVAPEQLYEQLASADFDGNINTDVVTVGDQITLAENLDLGTGVDGAFAPVSNTTLSGTLNFASVDIPSGVTVSASGAAPLIIRSTGPVTIDGTITVRGANGGNGVTFQTYGPGGVGVAGGGNGGDGVFTASGGPFDGSAGIGPGAGGRGTGWSGGGGAGYAAAGANAGPNVGLGGAAYDAPEIALQLGGSGGGGGSGGNNCGSGGGGAGGGMLMIVAPSITVNGSIVADGGNGGSDGTGNCGSGGGGSGGTVYLRARDMYINGSVSARGGVGGASTIGGSPYYGVGGAGADGRIRLDSATLALAGQVLPSVGFQSGVFASPGTSVATVAPSEFCTWRSLAFTSDEPGTSDVRFDVLDSQGNVLIADAVDGEDLSGLADTSLSFRATLSTTDQAPVLYEWSVSYVGRVAFTPN